jgi:hypothetical protein
VDVDPLDEVVPSASFTQTGERKKVQHSVKLASLEANLTECSRAWPNQRSRALRPASNRAIGTRNGEQDT